MPHAIPLVMQEMYARPRNNQDMKIQSTESGVKKLILSKSEWLKIGHQAGWSPKSEWQSFNKTFDEVKGEQFGQDGKDYAFEVRGQMLVVDHSDYSYPEGYGQLINIEEVEIWELLITEYDAAGAALRDQEDIKAQDPALYKQIEDACETWIKESHPR